MQFIGQILAIGLDVVGYYLIGFSCGLCCALCTLGCLILFLVAASCIIFSF